MVCLLRQNGGDSALLAFLFAYTRVPGVLAVVWVVKIRNDERKTTATTTTTRFASCNQCSTTATTTTSQVMPHATHVARPRCPHNVVLVIFFGE